MLLQANCIEIKNKEMNLKIAHIKPSKCIFIDTKLERHIFFINFASVSAQMQLIFNH